MKNLIAALILSAAANSAMAEGFAPWNDRNVAPSTVASASVAVVPAGFAPWRDRVVVQDKPVPSAVRMSDAFGSVFRPWS